MLNRRCFVATAALGVSLASPSLLHAQDYPVRPIRLIVPFPPGGALDTYVRLVQQELEKDLGQPIVVDNVAGAGGAIGAVALIRAKPDGYTMMAGPVQTLSVNAAVNPKLTYDPLTQFVPVIQTVMVNYILVMRPSLPIKSMTELIAYAKERPGKLSYATSGTGSAQHMAVALLQAKAGIDLLHVPYKGMGPALNDLLAGQVDMAIADVASLMPQVKAGKLRAIAVAGRKRSFQLPELPTISETVNLADYDVVAWQGIVVPVGTPASVVQRLNSAFNNVQSNTAIVAKLTGMGYEIVGGSPEAFRQYMTADVGKWKKVAKDYNITAE